MKAMKLLLLASLPVVISACAFVPPTNDVWELVNLADQRIKSGRYVGARNILGKALPIAKSNNDELAVARIHNDYCLSYALEGKGVLTAEDHCKESRKISDKNSYGLEIAHNERNMAQLWKSIGNAEIACYHLLEAKEQVDYLRSSPRNPPFGAGPREVDFLERQLNAFSQSMKCRDVAK